MYAFSVDGCEFEILMTDHAEARLKQRRVPLELTYDLIASLDRELLDLYDQDEFCILSKDLHISVVCGLSYEINSKGLPLIEIRIITVMNSVFAYVKKGTRVYKMYA